MGLGSFITHVLLATAHITCLVDSGQTHPTSITALGGHPWYWHLLYAGVFTATETTLSLTASGSLYSGTLTLPQRAKPQLLWSLRSGVSTATEAEHSHLQNPYHLGDSYTLPSSAASPTYNLAPLWTTASACWHCAIFSQEILPPWCWFLFSSQLIFQPQLTSIDCFSETKISLQEHWFHYSQLILQSQTTRNHKNSSISHEHHW